MTTKISYDDFLKNMRTSAAAKAKPQRQIATTAPETLDMKYILERRRKDGTVSFLVNLRYNRKGKEWKFTATFDTHGEAVSARDKAIVAYHSGAALPVYAPPATPRDILGPSVAEVIKVRLMKGKALGTTAQQVLRYAQESALGRLQAADVTGGVVTAYAEELSDGTRLPQTVAGYILHLSAALKWANRRKHAVIQVKDIELAVANLWEDKVIAKSAERDRRPTVNELERILACVEANKRQTIPLGKMILFALFSARRLSEICRIQWSDLKTDKSMILVRQMKHPTRKETNDKWCKLTPEALDIIQSMPRVDDRIFPFEGDSVGAAFLRHRRKVRVADLRFHDLRHEAISRLFEMEYTDRFVAQISGHKVSGGCLDRYEHVEEVGDKYANWPWFERVLEGDF